MEARDVSLKIAGMLLDAEAVKLNLKKPYTWSSGWKSPIYCDNRLTLSFPETRTFIKDRLCYLIEEHFPEVEGIAGVATAGIPQGALVADALDLPFVYVRSTPKSHGLENRIEGKVTKNQKLVVVEDLISTGGSSIKAAKSLVDARTKILGLVAIFTYGFSFAEEAFSKEKIPFHTLSSYGDLLKVAEARKLVREQDLIHLKSWRVDPENWGQ